MSPERGTREESQKVCTSPDFFRGKLNEGFPKERIRINISILSKALSDEKHENLALDFICNFKSGFLGISFLRRSQSSKKKSIQVSEVREVMICVKSMNLSDDKNKSHQLLLLNEEGALTNE